MTGYAMKQVPNHPRASDGRVYEHVLVAEKILGRYLKNEETVHHKDENKRNNSDDNIMIFATTADHTAHHKGTAYILDDEGIAHAVFKEYLCSCCGEDISRRSRGLCTRCAAINSRVAKRPSRKVLKRLIRNNSFASIGALFDVSCNAIRKWCKSESLPHLKSEVMKYSDPEWMTI